ncbi:MAG: aldo/keto reductase [Phycisphaerae bacterium]|nr:aldo/keto reductase [Phycisphaerae bacterium]
MFKKQSEQVDFGKRSGLKVYPVSIGAMRFPEDDNQAVALIRQAIDAGMIYIDTSRGYGDSEIKLGKALKDGYREKVILSTKCSPWGKKIEPTDDASAECTYKRIKESMQRLDVEYLDFYQIWNIMSPECYEKAVRKGGMLDGIRKAMDEGLVRHTGFTTHDKPENISRYIDEADWCETILFTYNMMNQTYKDVVAKAHDKGIATVVMNPMGGGMFAEGSPVFDKAVKDAVDLDNAIEAAHLYLASDPNVDTILCGITKPEDIFSTIENYQKPFLTPDQMQALEKAMAGLSMESMGFCTGCKYCLPCPKGINIPEMMNIVYTTKLLKAHRRAKEFYGWAFNEDNPEKSSHPTDCIECGQCEQKCTQRLKIIDELKYLVSCPELK